MDPFSFLIGFVAGIVVMVIFLTVMLLFRPWLHAFCSGAPIPMPVIIGMRLRGNPPKLIIDAYITMIHSGETIKIMEVESTYIAHKNQITDSNSLVQLVRKQNSNPT